MIVIKPGILPETKVHGGKCFHCGAEFEFQASEAVPESTCRNEDYLKIACPTCKKIVWVQV